MKTTLCSLVFIGVLVVCPLGCGHDHGPGSDHSHDVPVATTGGNGAVVDAHAASHVSKYNEVMAEFPGHKYALEIIDEKETTGLVTAFLTDAHFEPTEVDATELRLNFIVGGQPKVFILPRIPQDSGKPATFTLTDIELATLNCEGWVGEASVAVEIGGVPYSTKLIKLGHHDHDGHHETPH